MASCTQCKTWTASGAYFFCIVLQAPICSSFAGGALETADYVPPAAAVVRVSGDSRGGVCTLEIVNDLKREEDETMEVSLAAVAVAAGDSGAPTIDADDTTVVTITDDDGRYDFAINLIFLISF